MQNEGLYKTGVFTHILSNSSINNAIGGYSSLKTIKKGNTDFKPYLSEIANDILKINLEPGKYFLRYALIDFGLPLEEYGINIVKFVNSTEV